MRFATEKRLALPQQRTVAHQSIVLSFFTYYAQICQGLHRRRGGKGGGGEGEEERVGGKEIGERITQRRK